MPTITVNIDSISEARKFLYLAKNLKFVKNAHLENDFPEPLTDEDWIKPGRSATDEEIEARLSKIDSEILENKLYSFEEVKNGISEVLLKECAE